jgi:predicted GNAT family N-acyltransferase
MSSQYKISTNIPPKAEELMLLFAHTTWAKKRSVIRVRYLLERTDTYVTIRDGGKLIGYGRALTDGFFRALIDDIIIDRKYQKRGLGGQIVNELLNSLADVEEVFLNTGEHLEEFYTRYGFKRAKCLTMKI